MFPHAKMHLNSVVYDILGESGNLLARKPHLNKSDASLEMVIKLAGSFGDLLTL